ncbi:cobyrinate a,c-diamide synthase [Umezakia ovalisporum]|jgi:cobyrinic acid a,c-diamide synthase|uniref:Cobyrinate a,c-diamide synthase n=2 Tax=Umezakia ovalisporum TaxID=75695 RepID=A0AA43KDV0_9CYAN|nr:cobyrinate a,c-diamide synthase [Umezakia ovalisporum]MBI1240223.1 cobyrinate a,c-diamide synthase [Nostoc sp. RI_552]MDH6057907.1 cobyrinate a,c-diamide synthase [Umezakia ovalisporum FSS-43]MDH6062861.1 cobyrinate a,c-diamide synthase [Umezakia ovalisporum FSS-62]MDH6068752.1 cobyrinate a,c-diamide synthase [Umezakia ovalisporum APH033B]MDH6071931.1 cobyrinate a,c-diamide synthase [Umezakia ovalisporum CobakiLakeA]
MALVIAGERSGVGKTTVTLTLLASLRRRGVATQSFKVGPDYIDPMFHSYVTGRPCRNLDPVLTSEAYVQKCFAHHSQASEYSLVEGVMGLFDGVKAIHNQNECLISTDFASTAHLARLLNLPVVLVIDCSRLSGSVAAIAHGYCSFDSRIKIAGVVLNRVGSHRHLCLLQDSLAALQLPVLGVLRRQDSITIPDRHLGLIPTAELPELDAVISHLADLGDTCFDWEKLLPLLENKTKSNKVDIFSNYSTYPVKIAVARDRAFNFYYQDNLDLLQNLGAELVFWSPLVDTELPQGVQGMYFGGGFPEIFAKPLAANTTILHKVKTAILQGMPTIAECGGLMYLCEQIIDFETKSWPMVGVLPTSAVMGRNLTLGYRRAVPLQDNLLVSAGTNVYGHEFHRSSLTTHPHQPLFTSYRYDCDDNLGTEGWGLSKNLYASYIHLHWGESADIPQQFLKLCSQRE